MKTVSACWALACSVFFGGKIGRQPALLFDEIGADWDSTTLLRFISRAAHFGGQVVGTSSNWEYNVWEEASVATMQPCSTWNRGKSRRFSNKGCLNE